MRIVSVGMLLWLIGVCFNHLAAGQGKNRYQVYSQIIASMFHLVVMPHLADKYGMLGVAVSSSIQFVLRAIV